MNIIKWVLSLFNKKEHIEQKSQPSAPPQKHERLYRRGNKVGVQMLPKSTQYKNVRSRITASQWSRLRQTVCIDDRCCFCQESGIDQGYNHAFELHEVWEFAKKEGRPVQVLVDLQPLCPMCHKVAHIERWSYIYDMDVKNATNPRERQIAERARDKFMAHYRKVLRSDVNTGLKIIRNKKKMLPRGDYMIDLTYLNRYPFLGETFTEDETKFDVSSKYSG